MDIYTIDAETFFDDEFTLKKLTLEHYCRDPRFEVHGWGVRHPDGRTEWVGPQEFHKPEWKERFENAAVLCHHANFDLLILNHIYGIKPKFILCSLSMARLILGNHISVSLASLAVRYGLATKNIDYLSFKGKHWNELDGAAQKALADGALRDVEITWCLFERLMNGAEEQGVAT